MCVFLRRPQSWLFSCKEKRLGHHPSMRAMVCFGVTLFLMGCKPGSDSGRNSNPDRSIAAAQTQAIPAPDPCSLISVPHLGSNPTDQDISGLQEKIKKTKDPANLIEKLGWMFVRKARESFDRGFYKLAEQAPLCLD